MKVCVIGGGPAGVFAAIHAKNTGAEVVLVEKNRHLLAKVKVSGGGRCNLAHACYDPYQLSQYYPRGAKELLGPFHRFQTENTVSWFSEHGIQLKTEDDGRIFPVTDSSETVVQCLLDQLTGVEILLGKKLKGIEKRGDELFVHFEEASSIRCQKLILATGSDRDGYRLAEMFGHTIVKPVPSLFPLKIHPFLLKGLSGVVVDPVELKIQNIVQRGALLITHFGFSGPVVLHLSAWAARYLAENEYRTELTVNWVPKVEVFQEFLSLKRQYPQKELSNLFSLPKGLWKYFIDRFDVKKRMNDIADTTLLRFGKHLQSDTYTVVGKSTHKGEFVTCGGISLKEVDMRTMQSKRCSGLYFAGEILDIDGVTGGFNLQNAWTSGYLAGSTHL